MRTCTQQLRLPKNVRKVGTEETFSFLCHPGIPCFTHCCRQLELALTPYDVLRLKNAAGLTSSDFLERYVIIEREEQDTFPRLYLTMVDDGKASCVFVSDHGCTVYADRPGACRAYPIGRAAILKDRNTPEEFYVLLEENHCQGFGQDRHQSPKQYCQDQGLSSYNRFNDAVAAILQHEKIRQGMILSEQQIETYVLALYDLDTFRTKLLTGQMPDVILDAPRKQSLEEDEELLFFAIDWLRNLLFGRYSSNR
jgi:Fe-S-cluster containining protein